MDQALIVKLNYIPEGTALWELINTGNLPVHIQHVHMYN